MKLIPLTQGKSAMVDDEDFEELNQFKWFAHWARTATTWYAHRNVRLDDGSRSMLRMHTVITGYAITDHIDGDGLNNRRVNLREVTRAENARNQRRRRGQAHRFKGVRFQPGPHPWSARICDGRTRSALGCFVTEKEAALAYDDAVRKLFGEYGTYNFPRPGERSALTGEVMP